MNRYLLNPTILSGTLISLFDTGPMRLDTPTPWIPAADAAATLAAEFKSGELFTLLIGLGGKIACFLVSGSPRTITVIA